MSQLSSEQANGRSLLWLRMWFSRRHGRLKRCVQPSTGQTYTQLRRASLSALGVPISVYFILKSSVSSRSCCGAAFGTSRITVRRGGDDNSVYDIHTLMYFFQRRAFAVNWAFTFQSHCRGCCSSVDAWYIDMVANLAPLLFIFLPRVRLRLFLWSLRARIQDENYFTPPSSSLFSSPLLYQPVYLSVRFLGLCKTAKSSCPIMEAATTHTVMVMSMFTRSAQAF